jgi:hypothetical protein
VVLSTEAVVRLRSRQICRDIALALFPFGGIDGICVKIVLYLRTTMQLATDLYQFGVRRAQCDYVN